MMGWGLALFGLLIVVFLMLPLAKWQAWQTHYRQQQNVALYRAQVARQSDPELAKELGQRLLEDEKFFQNRPHFEQQSGEKSERFSFKFHLFLIVLLLTVPTLYYFSLPRYAAVEVGEQAFLAQQMQLMEQAVSQQHEDKITQLQQKLRQDPNHAENWLLLGQAYLDNAEVEHALIAYGNAQQLLGDKPAILGAIATAYYYQAGQKMTAKVDALLTQALTADPFETASLSLIATDAFVQGNYQKAAQTWQKMLDSDRPNVERRLLIQRIQMAQFRQQSN
ncbi:TPA: c-type cytochrome biogenesis protein [Pasteurella multocida]|uniref:tetratricopeptide repeat protein n=1 Tax=Pasteurella multocida TaxID=747 RepID=UPI000233F9A4|nr:c-type cytochrome biogenesis protein [Pasteurella multocida]AWW60107.1 protein NrfF [Pasteurellaceae bacterium 12591]AET16179.1 cytochrome c nitrite reductase, subunit NrfG [Pasteurella multocida 36950]AHE64679.1 cytochrome c nitrite reductase, subunit NrfG [Pasteurella multocida subsp. multocida str. HB03]AIN48924.1 TPR repeat family protein [Pasteurella multocida]ANJ90434.1 cytochrome c nitrite reductase, subunit NrfG [Pasteurella multocida subsp. multocida HB01]